MRFLLLTHFAVFLFATLFWGSSVFAATITVTTTADDVLSTTTPNGVCSLREAIINANNNASTYADCSSGTTNDVISLTGGQTYLLTIQNTGASITTPTSGTDEDYSLTGDLDIRNGLTISVTGTGMATIDASGMSGSLDRIFEVTGAYDLTIENCVIQGGYLVAPTGDVYGGGIYASVAGSTLTLTNSTVSGNTAISSAAAVRGGGIAVYIGSRLTLDTSNVSDNSATGSTIGLGAGIFLHSNATSNSTLTINDSTISGNTLTATSSYALGGGIYANTSANVTVSDSTITNNNVIAYTAIQGAGIYTGVTASTTINSCIISGNSATSTTTYSAGGGLYTYTTATVTDSTISQNELHGNYSQGGGVYSFSGTLTMDNTTVSENTATGSTTSAYAGGIYTGASANLIVRNDSVVSENEATGVTIGLGGGIYVHTSGTLTLDDSTISGNDATSTTSYVYGGGIYSQTSSTLTIDSSTISGNESHAATLTYGGGIYPLGTVTISNSTLSDNTATATSGEARGGGLYANSTTTVTNSTIAGNGATSTSSTGRGGGIYSATTPSLKSTLVVDNTASSSGTDCYGTINSYGYNLFESIYGCTLTAISGSADTTGSYSFLSDLADNGGPTHTHAFESNSSTNPAIDAGSCTTITSVSVTLDQRGEERGSTCDIGAYEMVCGDNSWSGSEACEARVEDSIGDGERCTSTCTVEHDADGDTYYAEVDDCDDADASIYPGAEEICDDEVDSDCDSEVGASTFYIDADGDGHGSLLDEDGSSFDCGEEDSPSGYAGSHTDCDDANASINSSIVETCNGIDDDCDGTIDNGLEFITYYADADADGYGDASSEISACSEPSDYVINTDDCDDTNALAYTGASEICGDDVDNDCDGVSDAGSAWYEDDDGDGYGDATDSSISCTEPAGSVANSNDCNDTVALAYTGAIEGCGDGVDNDCDGVTDEGDVWYDDDDGDTFGDAADSITACEQPENTVSNTTDCNDANASINPDSIELAGNEIDDNCDGVSEAALSEEDPPANDTATSDSGDIADTGDEGFSDVDDVDNDTGGDVEVDDVDVGDIGASSASDADDDNAGDGNAGDTTETEVVGAGGCSLILPHH